MDISPFGKNFVKKIKKNHSNPLPNLYLTLTMHRGWDCFGCPMHSPLLIVSHVIDDCLLIKVGFSKIIPDGILIYHEELS